MVTRNLALFFHLAAAIFWMGGMAFMVLALRPALAQLDAPVRLRLVTAVLTRFFAVVAISIAVLLLTGGFMMMTGASSAPPGWKMMAALGVLMMLVFGHIRFVPFRRLQRGVAAQDWPAGGAAVAQITLLAKFNLGLGWLAIAAVLLWR
jgi:uncharacterized membrane protein